MFQSFLTMLARDLSESLFALVHRFAEMTDALTDMGIASPWFRRIIVALTDLRLLLPTLSLCILLQVSIFP
jgi:hypothetical protein